jgi:antitoxin component YwqK of YwqJK toxin-antitoxin module
MKGALLILLLVSFGCTHKTTITEEELVPDVMYTDANCEAFTGKCDVVSQKNGKVFEQFTYKNGLPDGEMLMWYKNGKLKRKGYFREGKRNGKWETWDESGKKILEVHFKNDQLDGLFVMYNENGEVMERGIYKANKRTGNWTYNPDN